MGSPYAYGVPGARHAIVTVHAPPQPEELPVPVALAVASREERKAIMSALKHILVVANQTVSGDPPDRRSCAAGRRPTRCASR